MKATSLEQFYQRLAAAVGTEQHTLLPPDSERVTGHFNLFDVAEQFRNYPELPMPYDRRAYYKISLIRGRSRAEYANKVIELDQNALLFATPKVPYYWRPQDPAQAGRFCVFTSEFLLPTYSGVVLDELPLFQANGYPVFQVSDAQWDELDAIFQKMARELTSPYLYKYDLLRTYVLELIYSGQKLQPLPVRQPALTAAARIASLFTELLERQFPLTTPHQQLQLRSAKDFADRLAVHVNHLNKALKQHTGRTTTELIATRYAEEAKRLLLLPTWTIAQISDSLGFAEVADFSHFFKRHTALSPAAFRL
ncbi:helix-turn-helix domain-containing protein [Hymenobacter volaticus]|uniref:Helix-turn-helix transcriptional regulator n=1 Tax=Hymenobacter volaticus TaxID=2932254 RepID=A0ABY4GD96_9BACT|nr:AraC family transcriptional regulator [Hymenobacter volaticus]UOQ68895.1 helix-turn-helix transcriptional regulator [Hymenobacter volaticus]